MVLHSAHLMMPPGRGGDSEPKIRLSTSAALPQLHPRRSARRAARRGDHLIRSHAISYDIPTLRVIKSTLPLSHSRTSDSERITHTAAPREKPYIYLALPPPPRSPSLLPPMASPPPLALVTAGSAGLGAAVAELFARNGIRVVINYHGNAQRAEALVAKLKAVSTLAQDGGGRVDYHAIKADLSARADVERLVEETMAIMCPAPGSRRLDVLFSNGGWTRMTTLMNLEEAMVDEDWDRCFAMNVKSHLWLMYAARPYLEAAYSEKDGAASFITTASLAGVKVSGSSLAYSVTKAAQLHLAKGLAMIAAPKIRVNSVSPGLLMTVSLVILLKTRRYMLMHRHPGMGSEFRGGKSKGYRGSIETQENSYCRGK